MHFDNVFLYFPQQNTIKSNNCLEDLLLNLPVPQKAVDEIHIISSKSDLQDLNTPDGFNVQIWNLPIRQQFLFISLLFDRTASHEKNILIVQQNQNNIFSFLVGTGNLVGKFNVLPSFSLRSSDVTSENYFHLNNLISDENNIIFIISENPVVFSGNNIFLSNLPFLAHFTNNHLKVYKKIFFLNYHKRIVHSLMVEIV